MGDYNGMVRRQKALGDFGEFALQSDDLTEVLTEACRLVAEVLGTGRAKILEIQENGTSLLVRAGVGWQPDVVGKLRLPMAEHSSETFAVRQGKPIIMGDVRKERRFDLPGFMREAGVVALANVPIFLPNRRIYGLLQVDATEPRDFGAEDTEFLRTYTTILGPVIDRLLTLREMTGAEERFRLVVGSTRDYAIFLTDAEDRITDWLPGAEAVYGFTPEEAVGQPAAMLFTPEDRERERPQQEIDTARREGAAPNVRWHLRKGGERVFIEGAVSALHDADYAVRGYLKIGQDITERRRVQEALRESEEQLRALVEGVSQLVWRAVGHGGWTWASPQWTAYTGQAEEESHGLGWLDPVHPDDRGLALGAWEQVRANEGLQAEFRIRNVATGAYRWFQTRAAPRRDARGGVVEWLGTSTDIHQLKDLQQSQAVMVAELQHRTRNLIAVVRGIAEDTMGHTGPAPAFQSAFSARLTALSRVQGLLSRAEVEPITLAAVVRLELDAFGAGTADPRVTVSGPDMWLPNSDVQTLALALHELATNARKYGALSHEGGRLAVTWSERADGGERRILLDWTETGLEHAPTRIDLSLSDGGYGRELIEHALPHALGARTSFVLTATGVHCTIDLPTRPDPRDRGPS